MSRDLALLRTYRLTSGLGEDADVTPTISFDVEGQPPCDPFALSRTAWEHLGSPGRIEVRVAAK